MYEDKEWKKYFKFETDTEEVRQQLAEHGYTKDFTQEIQENIDFSWERHPHFREGFEKLYQERGPIIVRFRPEGSIGAVDEGNVLYLCPEEIDQRLYFDKEGKIHKSPFWSTIEHEVKHLKDFELLLEQCKIADLARLAAMQAPEDNVDFYPELSGLSGKVQLSDGHIIEVTPENTEPQFSYDYSKLDWGRIERFKIAVAEPPAVSEEDKSLAMEELPERRVYFNAFSQQNELAAVHTMLENPDKYPGGFEFLQGLITAEPVKPMGEKQRLQLVEHIKKEVLQELTERYPNPHALPDLNDDASPNIPQFSFKKPPQWER